MEPTSNGGPARNTWAAWSLRSAAAGGGDARLLADTRRACVVLAPSRTGCGRGGSCLWPAFEATSAGSEVGVPLDARGTGTDSEVLLVLDVWRAR